MFGAVGDKKKERIFSSGVVLVYNSFPTTVIYYPTHRIEVCGEKETKKNAQKTLTHLRTQQAVMKFIQTKIRRFGGFALERKDIKANIMPIHIQGYVLGGGRMPIKIITKTCELCGQELCAISEPDALNQLKNHRNGRKCKFRQRIKRKVN